MAGVTHTYTVATLEVSSEAYAEIRRLLLEAGHNQRVWRDDQEMLDMSGLALVRIPVPPPPDPDPSPQART